MRLNFRKIGAIAAGALMVGLTMGTAAANYPSPFVTGNGPDVAIVYGSGAGVSSLDIVQAGTIATSLQSYMSSGGGGSAVSVSGGDNKALSSSTRKLYYGDAINAPIPSLTYTELPTVLASGTFVDLSGTQYGYTQTVKVGPAALTFGNDGGNYQDPALYIYATTTAGTLYNYTVSFTKNLNVSDATNVEGQKINLQGIDYVIGTGSTNQTLYLYGSGTDITVNGGETQTVTVGGVSHTVELVTTSGANAIIQVDGVSKTVTTGSNYAFAGGINIYVKTVIVPAFAGDVRQVELIVGASSLQLTNGQSVKKGADATSIQGTSASVTGAGSGMISGFSIQVAAAKTQNDSIAIGGSFTDPVLGGLKLTFADAVPPLMDPSRSTVTVDAGTGSSQYVTTTFTSARAGAAGAQKLNFVYDNTTASVTAVQPLLAHTSSVNSNGRGMIHVLEGDQAQLNDWVIVNQGDAGTILQVDDISNKGDGLSGTVTLTDVITGQSQVITVTNASAGTYYQNGNVNAWGGTGYVINVNPAFTKVNISWNSGATALFPRIKLANGGWLAFLTATSPGNGTSVIFPDGVTTLGTTGNTVSSVASSLISTGGMNWSVSSTAGVPTVVGLLNPACNFNVTYGPALLYIEPKKWNDGSHGDYICVPLTSASSGTQMILGTPVFNGTNSGFVSLTSSGNTYQQDAVDQYGTFVTKNTPTNANGLVTIYTPASQMYFDVLFSSVGTAVTGGTTAVAGGQLGNVLVKDSEVSSVSGHNLIVVGGSCINSVAASLLSAGCGSSFTSATGVGQNQFLIQSFASPYSSSKIALVVAGYEAADTVNAATYLTTQSVDTTVGKKYEGTSATSAQLVVTP